MQKTENINSSLLNCSNCVTIGNNCRGLLTIFISPTAVFFGTCINANKYYGIFFLLGLSYNAE